MIALSRPELNRQPGSNTPGAWRMKKILKTAGIAVGAVVVALIAVVVLLVVKQQIDASKPLLDDDYYESFASPAPLEKKYARRGGQNVAYTEFSVEKSVIGKIGAWYPQQLESDGARYPMVVVVNGSNTKASMYKPFFERLASWGFVVVGTEDGQAGTGETTSVALDFMLNAPRDSVLHGRIDADNIGVVGYSQGGAGAIRAVTEHGNSGAFKTIFTGSAAYAALAKNMGWGYDIAKVTIPYFMTAGTGTSEDAGVKDTSSEFGGVAPLSSLADNYNQMPGCALKVRARVAGAEHWQIQMLTDGYMTAWMRYQLQADPEAASVFIGDKAELLVNRKWQDVEKNR